MKRPAVWLASSGPGNVTVHATRDLARHRLDRWFTRRIELGLTEWRWSGASWELLDRDLGNVGNVRRVYVRGAR